MWRALAFIALTMIGLSRPAGAEPLVADLSKHLVAITTGFAGTDVLLFGAVEDSRGGGDVVVVVRGPPSSGIVRRRARQAGIWINSGRAEIGNIPSFYRVAATRPLAEITRQSELARLQIGVEHLDLTVRPLDSRAGIQDYRAAIIRLKQRQGLFGTRVQDIGFLGRQLFRTEMYLPANVPVGTYLVEIYLFRDGRMVSLQTTPLTISKVGVGAALYEFAHRQAVAYGIIAVLLAASAGWLAAVALRKG